MKANAKKDVPEVSANQLAKVLAEAGVVLFKQRTGLPLNQAQRNLEGRTNYADDKTLADNKAMIHSVQISEDNLVLALVESVQAGASASSGRVYRPVFFDVFGNLIYQPTVEESYDSVKKATLQMWEQLDEIDVVKATIEGLTKKRDACQAQVDKYDALIEEVQ